MARWVPALLLLATALCAGCVKSYQREWLALPVMQLAPVDEEEAHVLESREGSAGATGAVAGGCGCN